MQTPPQSGSREKLLQAVLLIAACFAIGSVGFFLAVLLQKSTAPAQSTGTIQPVADQVSTSTKERILESLGNQAPSGASASASSTSSSTSTGSTVTSGQGSNSAATAAKLKALESLKSQ